MLLGEQRPRVRSVPPAVTSAGQETIELAASAGVMLDRWQQFALVDALGETAAGLWAALEVALIVARQNGKGEVLLARELAGLFLFGERLIIHTAHEFKTASEAFLRIKTVIENTDDLRKRCRKPREANGEQAIELLNGQRLRFLARSKGSGRGFTGDLIVLDEAYAIAATMIGALMPTLSARPNPQLWYASSAAHADSEVLRGIIARGTAGSRGLCYLEHSADPKAANDDRRAWAQANPALAIRIAESFVELEYDSMVGSGNPELVAEFRRERLGISEDENADAPIDEATWAGLANRHAQLADPVGMSVDVTPDRGKTSITAADGETVELIDNRPGTGWVVDRVVDLDRKWHPCGWAIDPASPAASLIPDIKAAGIDVYEPGMREVAAAWASFYDAAVNGKLAHRDDPTLNAAVAGAKERPLGDAKALGRKLATADISPLVAGTLARHVWQLRHDGGDVAANIH
jgi:hypothetical protein